jgi:hypothetical protein
LKDVAYTSLVAMPKKTAISLTKPLMPGRAREAMAAAVKKAKAVGILRAMPP